jgi:hypothetical protein
VRLEEYEGLISKGRWAPIIADALRQIGVPYPATGFHDVLKELYDGEGEQAGKSKEDKSRPVVPWKVSRAISSAKDFSDDNFYSGPFLGTYLSRRRDPRPAVKQLSSSCTMRRTHHLTGGLRVCSSSRTLVTTAY